MVVKLFSMLTRAKARCKVNGEWGTSNLAIARTSLLGPMPLSMA